MSRRLWAFVLAALVVLGTINQTSAHETVPGDMSNSVFRVLAEFPQGKEISGSAVAIAADRFVTNCHVIRNAHRIEIVHRARRWQAVLHAGDADKDVCILVARDLVASPLTMGSTSSLKHGDRVSAIGYSSDHPVITHGTIESLFTYSGARVIQTSAAFDQGASGGALLNASGELVGVLTFKAPSGGAFHFAVPVEWIATVDRVETIGQMWPGGDPFYERDPKDRPHFLRAVWYQSKQKWAELFSVCQHWVSEEPDSAEAKHLMVKTADRLLNAQAMTFPTTSSRKRY